MAAVIASRSEIAPSAPGCPINVEKEAVFPSLRNLHAIVDEIDEQLVQLTSACPADWSPNRRTIDQKMRELQLTLGKLSERVRGPLIPDSLSWISQ